MNASQSAKSSTLSVRRDPSMNEPRGAIDLKKTRIFIHFIFIHFHFVKINSGVFFKATYELASEFYEAAWNN